jgi:hypothetical protein
MTILVSSWEVTEPYTTGHFPASLQAIPFFFRDGVETSPLLLSALTGLLYPPRMTMNDDECGAALPTINPT